MDVITGFGQLGWCSLGRGRREAAPPQSTKTKTDLLTFASAYSKLQAMNVNDPAYEVTLMDKAHNALRRIKKQRIRVFRSKSGKPGEYVTPSFTTRGHRPATWYRVTATRNKNGRLVVVCNHPQVLNLHSRADDRDAFGNSTCKHAFELLRRLMRCPDEEAAIVYTPPNVWAFQYVTPAEFAKLGIMA